MKRWMLWGIIGLFLISLVSCASSPRRRRVEALEKTREEVDTLKKERADINVQVDEVKTELQVLSGKIEENQHKWGDTEKTVLKQNERLDELIADYDKKIISLETLLETEIKKNQDLRERLEAIEKKGRPASSPSRQPSEPVGQSIGDVRLDYANGVKRFKAGEYSSAITLFTRYNKNFPAGRSVQNSMFFLADAHFKLKDYQNAILKYEEYKEKYPKGNRVAEAIFRQGLSFKQIGKSADAKLFFEEILSNHPKSPFADKAKGELKQLK